VAYATTPLAGWITAIDRSPSGVFASARRVLALQLASIVAAALLILGLLIWIFRRASRNAVAERQRSEIAAELTRSLADAYTSNDVAAALATALSKSFAGSAAVVGLAQGSRGELTLAAVAGERPSTIPVGDPVLLAPAAAAYERGTKQIASGQAAVAKAFPDLQRAAARGIATVYATPILGRRGGRLGAVALLLADQVPFAATDDALVEAHLEQAIQALGRTFRQERDHEVAVELQRSLLPTELPAQDDVAFAARYHAGGTGVEVGGDWYDAVRRPDGVLHVSVGDVAGRGIAAATLMAQLRNAFRAYAFDCTSPAEITRRLRRHIPSGGMVTTVCLTFDPYTRRFGYSLAGHPPILILDGTTGTVSAHSAAGSPPLGFASAESITEEWLTLPEPATVVAYTDGLVERRGVNIDAGIERIVAASPRRRAATRGRRPKRF
jgi:cytoskeletal protein RodZ